MVLSPAEYWAGRDRLFAGDLTPEIKVNAAVTLDRVSAFLTDLPVGALVGLRSWHVNSGWRPPAVNQRIPGAAPASKHMTGQAIDVADGEGDLGAFVVTAAGLALLGEHELWIESPAHTPRWVHFQTVPPKSGRRIFIP